MMRNAQGIVYPLPEGVAGSAAVGGCTHVDAASVHRSGTAIEARVIGGTVQQVPDPAWSAPLIPDASWTPDEDQTEDDRPYTGDPDAEHPLVPRFVPLRRPVPMVADLVITPQQWPAFMAWCVAERARPVNGGVVKYIEEDALLYMLGVWMGGA
jgi:hypothetical protein